MRIKRFNESITDDVNFYKEIEHYEFIGWDSEHKRRPLTEDDFNDIKKIIGKKGKMKIDKKVFDSGCVYILCSNGNDDLLICQFDDEWYTVMKIDRLKMTTYIHTFICDGLDGLKMALNKEKLL